MERASWFYILEIIYSLRTKNKSKMAYFRFETGRLILLGFAPCVTKLRTGAVPQFVAPRSTWVVSVVVGARVECRLALLIRRSNAAAPR